jgi:3-hydroxyisobutyrate dehydrogenase
VSPPDRIQTVALIGAGGTMGRGMAPNLARAGLEVRAWNRTAPRLEEIAGQSGITACLTATEAAAGADAVITILSDADAVLDSMSGPAGAAAGAAEGTIWLQMSTIGAQGIERCAELSESEDLVLVDAPVLGTKKPAEEGELLVFAAGPDEVRDVVAPVFDAVGEKTIWLGEAGAATRLKVAINTWILGAVEGTAEMLALARAVGVDPEDVLAAIAGGPLDLPYLQLKARMMLDGEFDPSFRLALAAKDAGLALEAAREAGLELPMLEANAEHFARAAREHGDEDLAATYLAIASRDASSSRS